MPRITRRIRVGPVQVGGAPTVTLEYGRDPATGELRYAAKRGTS
jgi:hypothetical protein